MLLPTADDHRRLADLDQQIEATESELAQVRKRGQERFARGSDTHVATVPVPEGHRFPLDSAVRVGGEAKWELDGNPSATTAIEPERIEGIAGRGIRLANEYGFLSLTGVGHLDAADRFTAALWVRPEQPLADVNPAALRTILGTAGQKNQIWRGWEFNLDGQNRLVVRLIHSLPDNLIVVRTEDPIEVDAWTHVGFVHGGLPNADFRADLREWPSRGVDGGGRSTDAIDSAGEACR